DVPPPSRFAPQCDAGCLHELFEAAAYEWPDAVAIDVPPGRSRPERMLVSYAELDRRASAIAAHLSACIADECVIAILLPRDSDLLYATQLAVLKAGAAFMCIDPGFPDDRINLLLADIDAAALVTDASGRKRTRDLLHV